MKRYTACKDINKLIRRLLQQGWVYRRRGKHGALIAPAGNVVTIPTTPSDSRTLYNLSRYLKGDCGAGI